jgi:hypothetical protein
MLGCAAFRAKQQRLEASRPARYELMGLAWFWVNKLW